MTKRKEPTTQNLQLKTYNLQLLKTPYNIPLSPWCARG